MKRVAVAGAVLIVLAVAWFAGRPAWRGFQERQAVARAQQFMAAEDYRNASLSARRALSINPTNLQACRVMAELTDRAGLAEVLEWCRRIVQIEPTIDNQMRLVAAGLRFEGPPYSQTAGVLATVQNTVSNSAPVYVLAGELALKQNQIEAAAVAFSQAVRLEPTNLWHQLNLAALSLRSENPAFVSEARERLNELTRHSEVAPVALRWLVEDARQTSRTEAAIVYSRRLASMPAATFEDRLQHLDLVYPGEGAEGMLEDMLAKSSSEPRQILMLTGWCLDHGLTNRISAYLAGLPAEKQEQVEVSRAWAEYYATTQDWAALESKFANGNWRGYEFLRFAYLARAATGRGQGQAASLHWRSAIREAVERDGAAFALLRAAREWGMNEAAEDLLWQLNRRTPKELWPLRELDRMYVAAGNTRGLNRVHARLMELAPTNTVARNNFAGTALLLGTDLEQAHRIARELYLAKPEDPVITSTYGYSLHLQGRTAEAVQVFETLKPEQTRQAGVALYYGVILAGAGRTNESARLLSIARTANLLPEERKLLQQTGG